MVPQPRRPRRAAARGRGAVLRPCRGLRRPCADSLRSVWDCLGRRSFFQDGTLWDYFREDVVGVKRVLRSVVMIITDRNHVIIKLIIITTRVYK